MKAVSGSKDQFVRLRQPQAINFSVVVDLDFAHLVQQLGKLDPEWRLGRSLRCRDKRQAGFRIRAHVLLFL